MKKRVSKDIILFIILIPVFLFLAFFISSRIQSKLPSYSVINKSRTGLSVFYKALKELKYPVERTLKPIESCDENSIQIAAETSNFDINNEEIKGWIENGGTLVYLRDNIFGSIEYEVTQNLSITTSKLKKGNIIEVEGRGLTNKALIKSSDLAYKLLMEIDKYPYENIYFNEAHLYPSAKKSLWDSVPIGIKYICYQLIIILIAFFYYKGKRFGKPIPLSDEVERKENEYLYSTASLYRQAKCWDLMVEGYYKSLLSSINYYDRNWLEYWERGNLPSYDQAKKVFDFMNNRNEKAKRRDYIQIVNTIEHLKNILKKRGDLNWKALKKVK